MRNLVKNKFSLLLTALFCVIAIEQANVIAKELYTFKKSINIDNISTIKIIEDRIYGKSYSRDNLKNRISRLEKSFFGKVHTDSINERLARLMLSFNEGEEYIKSSKKLVIIDLMESRYLKQTFDKENIDTRLARLEVQFFGSKNKGTIEQRYDYLIENVPQIKEIIDQL